ncbi:hypothetical protein KKD52_05025 [Myxococcota bacterium]|nr:hypothetical protein [Myxococcota bacterium]MBU1413423.1 hypothetical protein [Myxococcota bacterium]MBU1509702.1 hypothetical protein [Myxococcota bacterium]
MKYLLECPDCGQTTQVRFAITDGRLAAACSVCGNVHAVPLEETGPAKAAGAGSEPASGTDMAGQESCPKCGSQRGDGQESCPRCGLVFSLWVPPAEPFAEAPELAAQWSVLRKIPPSDPRHDRFLEACFRAGALSDAVRAYKTLPACATGLDTGDGKPAAWDPAARIRQIQLLSQMQFTPTNPVDRSKARIILWVLMFLVMLAALYIWTITPDDLLR